MNGPCMFRWFALTAIIAVTAPNAGLGQIYGDCLPPQSPTWALERPHTDENDRFVQDEVAAYFSAASNYLACIDDERARVMAEAQYVTDVFNEYLESR